MKLGFACLWAAHRPSTWSGTPWALRSALMMRTDLADVEASFNRPESLVLKTLYARRAEGRWTSTWKSGVVTRDVLERRLRDSAREAQVDAVLQIQDLAEFDQPYVPYQDLSYGVLLSHLEQFGHVPHFSAISARRLARLASRQRRIYESATGILVMSDFLRRHLIEVEGVEPHRVAVAPPGISLKFDAPGDATWPDSPQAAGLKVLMIGRDFYTKGGDVVVEALRLVRRDSDPRATLTVIGPSDWPLPGPIPDGVTFLGPVPHARLAAHLSECHVFAMPSRLEGFGIALLEALAAGIPCVARNAFAMPEIVTDGVDGILVDELTAESVASALVRAGYSDSVREQARSRAEQVRSTYTWDHTAEASVNAIQEWTR